MHNLQGGVSDYNSTCVAGWEGQNGDVDTQTILNDPDLAARLSTIAAVVNNLTLD